MRRSVLLVFVIFSLGYIAMLWMAYSSQEPISVGLFYLSIFYGISGEKAPAVFTAVGRIAIIFFRCC